MKTTLVKDTEKTVSLVCPACQTELLQLDTTYHCEYCKKDYPVKEGVVCFLKENDTFYEGSYTATINFIPKSKKSLRSLIYLYFINNHYLWYIRKHIKPGNNILDVACGGGIRYLAQKGEVTGIDLSFSSLKKTTRFYRLSVQADALNMPFPDATYDLVTSCYAFEHFSSDKKQLLLEQFYHVLKPKGKIILLFDCDNDNPLFQWVKKYPELYKKCFVELDHHCGLQKPSENIKLIENAGFKILEYRASNKTPVQHLPVYQWMESYGKVSKLVVFASKLAFYIGKYRITNLGWQAFVTIFDDIVEKIFPLDWARLLLIVAEKDI
jgi:ubiquinone/menaquinone biosynthesis C-methylase UbiE